MPDALTISGVTLHAAPPEDVRRGLLGWVTCTIADALVLDGITLRRTLEGRLTLSFPARSDRRGRQHPFVRPLDDPTRRAIEAAVFRALGLDGEGGTDGR